MTEVAVVGQGYVGLPLAIAAADAGHNVVGLDCDKLRVDALNEGCSPVGDVGDEELRRLLTAGRYRASHAFEAVAGAEVVVICVPTPYHHEAPDLSHVEEAARGIGPFLSPGTLVILESTTYPGTTETLLCPVLEEASGMRAGDPDGFDLVFSPERIDPGNPTFRLSNTPKIVGGVTAVATRRAIDFYGSFVDTVVPVSEPRAAEMAKLLENTFRHINIALVNELAMLCHDMDIDVWEVIDAAASKPFGFMPFFPGPGVGGHCIPVDPMYLSWCVRQFGGAAKFIELARDVNAAMPAYCVSRVQDLLNDAGLALNGAKVLVVGVAYKADIGDLRESPALPLIERLLRKGAVVSYHDPHVPELRVGGELLRSAPLTSVTDADCVLVVTAHSSVDYGQLFDAARLVFDTRNIPAGHDLPNVVRL
jgi:nucleotide sugar dehydrogenase